MTFRFKDSDAKEVSEQKQGKVNSGTLGSTADHLKESSKYVGVRTLQGFRRPLWVLKQTQEINSVN